MFSVSIISVVWSVVRVVLVRLLECVKCIDFGVLLFSCGVCRLVVLLM